MAGPPQNLGHVVTIGGKTFLHVGDTEGRIADFEPFRLADAQIDVAILPAWMLTEGEGPVGQEPAPRVHLWRMKVL